MKKLIKNIIQKFGYEINVKRIKRHIYIKPKFNKNNKYSDILEKKDIHTFKNPINNNLILESKLNKLNFKEMQESEQSWGFTECRAGGIIFYMGIFGNDDGVALRFLNNGYYEKFTTTLWSKFAEKSNLVIDIGAHTGSYTLAARLSNVYAKVISFEPHYLNFARLSLNLRANGLESNDIYMLAVSDENQVVNFEVPRGNSYHSSGGKIEEKLNATNLDGYWVNTVSLDNFFDGVRNNFVDLVKIDTEGHELKVLQGMWKIIEKNHPTIFFEYITSSNFELEEFLKNFGYEIFCLNDASESMEKVQYLEVYFNSDNTLDMTRLNRIAVHQSNKDHYKLLKSFSG